jgi:hypothetical protein
MKNNIQTLFVFFRISAGYSLSSTTPVFDVPFQLNVKREIKK